MTTHPIYATRAQLAIYGLPASALKPIAVEMQDAHLDAASRLIDTYLRGRYQLPILNVPLEVTQLCCQIAAFTLLSARGFDQTSMGDAAVLANYERALKRLTDVQRGFAHLDVLPTVSASSAHVQPIVISSSAVAVGSSRRGSNRGW